MTRIPRSLQIVTGKIEHARFDPSVCGTRESRRSLREHIRREIKQLNRRARQRFGNHRREQSGSCSEIDDAGLRWSAPIANNFHGVAIEAIETGYQQTALPIISAGISVKCLPDAAAVSFSTQSEITPC